MKRPPGARKCGRAPTRRRSVDAAHGVAARDAAVVHVTLAVAVEQRHVHPVIFITNPEVYASGGVEEVGVKDDGAVLPVWDINRACALLSQERLDDVRAAVICGKIP